MAAGTEIKVPDIGDFDAVEVIEVLVAAGDTVEQEQPLITLESDKATMEVPATAAGKVTEVKVKEGDKVAQGDVIVVVEEGEKRKEESEGGAEQKGKATGESEEDLEDDSASKEKEESAGGAEQEAKPRQEAAQAASPQSPTPGPDDRPDDRPSPQPPAPSPHSYDYDLLVLGSGPGGYTAAFRAADLGLNVVLVERYPSLGGVCLNVGCIPSKALLHAAKVIDDAAAMGGRGLKFAAPQLDLPRLLQWKQSVVDKLTGGLGGLAKKRKVKVVTGTARFSGPNEVEIDGRNKQRISFGQAIIAAGSEAAMLPDLPDDARIVTSTGALAPRALPKSLLVIGGGIIGLEMANVYAALGAAVDVVEMTNGLLPGADRDLVKPLHERMGRRCRNIWLDTKVTGVKANKKSLTVSLDGADAPASERYELVLIAVGRRPNGHNIGAGAAGVEVDERGFIGVDAQCRSNVPHIFAIGDISGEPQLAHRASHMGKAAAEVAAGHKSAFDPLAIPSVVYTDPEVAWTGLTEAQAKDRGIAYDKGSFPWAASGRALGMGLDEGMTKILFDKDSGRAIGAGAVGAGAGELIAELGLAIEMGADAEDIALTVHAHPTLSETVAMAAEAAAGTLTDLYQPRKP